VRGLLWCNMHLIIDGYNLLHAGHSTLHLNPADLQRERDRLVDRLSAYRRQKPCQMTVVFDGWQRGRPSETREVRKGIELIFSRLGEKADEVIKRIVREMGGGSVVITSDRDVSRYVEGMSVAVIPSDQFREKMERPVEKPWKGREEEEATPANRKGPSRKLSKKERRKITAFRKL
jgi:predicted RNA-binding protein with PIN domain